MFLMRENNFPMLIWKQKISNEIEEEEEAMAKEAEEMHAL